MYCVAYLKICAELLGFGKKNESSETTLLEITIFNDVGVVMLKNENFDERLDIKITDKQVKRYKNMHMVKGKNKT